MASTVMRAMRTEEAEKISADMIERLYKRPCLCGCPYEDICGVKNIGACKVARSLRERLAKGREQRRKK